MRPIVYEGLRREEHVEELRKDYRHTRLNMLKNKKELIEIEIELLKAEIEEEEE